MANEEFKPDKYRDEYRERALELLEEKRKGDEITVAADPARKPAPAIDLMEALKRSIGAGAAAPATKAAGGRAPGRRAAARPKVQRPKKPGPDKRLPHVALEIALTLASATDHPVADQFRSRLSIFVQLRSRLTESLVF
jgi:hypothetical protein